MNNLNKVQKKKKKSNPFWAFAMEFKNEQLRRGVRFHDDNHVKEIAGQRWSQMSQQQKDSYKEESETYSPNMRQKKFYTNYGIDAAEVIAKEKKITDEYESMVNEIKQMIIDANENEELDNLVFYFISTTSFFVNGDDVYPAELAMAKFSLKEGIIDDFQIRINPGKLPLGSAFSAMEKSKMHKYPLPSSMNCEGETDYMAILEGIINFLHPLEKLPILFALGNTQDDIEVLRETRRTVEKIFYESQEDDSIQDLKIYPINELFLQLQKTAISNKNRLNGTNDPKLTSISYAERAFLSERSLWEVRNGCEFHINEGVSEHCCLNKVRSFGYIISKWCSNGKAYPLLVGKHFPPNLKPKTEVK